MMINVNLGVLKPEDAQAAVTFLQDLGVDAPELNENSDVDVNASEDEVDAIEEYQDNPNLPRFMYVRS